MKNCKDNQLIDDAEKIKVKNDIAEIDQMLCYYAQTGYLDQDRAIQKIMDTRRAEPAVEIVLMPKNPTTAVSYRQLTKTQLCEVLYFIQNYLEGKLIEKTVNELTEGQNHD